MCPAGDHKDEMCGLQLMSFCSKFIDFMCADNYCNVKKGSTFKVIAKINGAVFLPHSVNKHTLNDDSNAHSVTRV